MTGGRDGINPVEIPVVGWKDLAFRVKAKIAKDRVGLLAAGVEFYGLLALFPAVTTVIAIGRLLIEPHQIIAQLNGLSGLMPEEVIAIITNQATAVAGSRQGGLGFAAIISFLIAFYSASTGMASLIQGLNIAYDEEETRGFIERMLVTFALTLVLIVGLICGLTATLAVPAILAFVDMGPVVAMLINAAPLDWVDRADYCRPINSIPFRTLARCAEVEMDLSRGGCWLRHSGSRHRPALRSTSATSDITTRASAPWLGSSCCSYGSGFRPTLFL